MNRVPGTEARQPALWQEEMARALRDPRQLLRVLDLPESLLPGAEAGGREFSVFVPPSFLAKIHPGDPQDPLLRQVLPLHEETLPSPGFSPDPLEEERFLSAPGLLEKYSGRSLLVTTGVCAIHCRYCFRRHHAYQEGSWRQAWQRLQEDPQVEEVLLSGGDPLAMGPAAFRELVEALDGIPHLRRLRIHTRLPVVIPARIDEELLSLLEGLRLRVYLVLHANHAQELGPELSASADRLRRCGVVLLNQSVLLRGVNDDLEALVDLSRGLIDRGILPYYLHLLDPVQGAAHFEVPAVRGQELVEAMRARLPGYGVPLLVREVPGAPAKLPV